MTDRPDDLPDDIADAVRAGIACYGRDAALGIRLLLAMLDTDAPATVATLDEIEQTDAGGRVLLTLAGVALDLLAILDGAGVLEGGAKGWLERAAMLDLDLAAEFGGDTPTAG